MIQDVRFALRLLRKDPVSTVVAVATLALGIGATTSVYSLIDALMLHPLPAVYEPDRLVAVFGTRAKKPERLRPLSWANYAALAEQTEGETVARLAAAADCDLSLLDRGPAERIAATAVSSNYFETLGLRPALGRLLSRGDENAPVAVLGYGLWQRRFGGKPVIGSTVVLNGKPVTVVGVAPQGFWGTDLETRHELWLPLGVYSQIAAGVLRPFSGQHDRKQEWLHVVGRLAPGVSPARAEQAFALAAGRLAAAYPADNEGLGARVLPLSELVLGQEMRPRIVGSSTRLLLVMLLMLAVAVINVAGVLLARALPRRGEVAIRLSLGASRGRLVRQLFIEGLVLGLLAAAGGVALARAGLPLLEQLELPGRLAVRDLGFSGRVLGFALAVTLVSCLGFALVPALQAARTDLILAIRGDAMQGRHGRLRLHEVLVGLQLVLAFLILSASGLMLRTFANLRSIDPGFDPSRILVASVDLAPAGYEGPRVALFYRDLLERLRHLPGVTEASMASALPVMGANLQVDLTVTLEDSVPGSAPADSPPVRHVLVGSRYLQTAGMRLLRGRDFGPTDEVSQAGAVLLNETAARLLWPGREPLGRRLRLVESETPFEVIGMVQDATYSSLKEKDVPVIYLAHSQYELSFIGELLAPEMTLLIRTTGEPWQVLGAVREAVRAMDGRLPVFGVATLDERLASTVGVERQAAALYTGLALLVAALTLLGLYGVLTRAVVERTREIGIRLACGASPAEVRRLILRRTVLLTLGSLAAGALLAAPASRMMESQLYGIKGGDLFTWVGAALILAAAALLVSAVPAGRAAHIDPSTVLRR